MGVCGLDSVGRGYVRPKKIVRGRRHDPSCDRVSVSGILNGGAGRPPLRPPLHNFQGPPSWGGLHNSVGGARVGLT